MLVSHESPICLFEDSKYYNDFEYALAPSVLSNTAYRDFYRQQSDSGRTVWLDTGVFEEGKPRTDEELLKCIDEIKPTHIICPDILQDKHATIEGYHRFKLKLDNQINLVVVAQGKTEDDFLSCFEYFLYEDVSTICIPYNIHFYNEYLQNRSKKHVMSRWMIIELLRSKFSLPLLKQKHIHLLGCSDPIELKRYKSKAYSFIKSIDTSSPIIHGLYGQRYTDNGLPCEKIKHLMVDLLDYNVNSLQMSDIMFNISKFKEFT